jgi:hypothetical protein
MIRSGRCVAAHTAPAFSPGFVTGCDAAHFGLVGLHTWSCARAVRPHSRPIPSRVAMRRSAVTNGRWALTYLDVGGSGLIRRGHEDSSDRRERRTARVSGIRRVLHDCAAAVLGQIRVVSVWPVAASARASARSRVCLPRYA